jgi:hypothetical protein
MSLSRTWAVGQQGRQVGEVIRCAALTANILQNEHSHQDMQCAPLMSLFNEMSMVITVISQKSLPDIQKQVSHSQHSIFFITYKWGQYAGKPFKSSVM